MYIPCLLDHISLVIIYLINICLLEYVGGNYGNYIYLIKENLFQFYKIIFRDVTDYKFSAVRL